ncbi:hypothetical protein HAX54_013932, partial [Datura stramonium]|nr:hypothetical protein [Datura stramonium]
VKEGGKVSCLGLGLLGSTPISPFIKVGDGWNQSEVQIAQAKPGNGPQRND